MNYFIQSTRPVDKFTLRKIIRSKLREQFLNNNKLYEQLNNQIWDSLRKLSVFIEAETDNTLMVYLNLKNEIETARFIKLPTIIPFCSANEIVPFRLFALDELETGTWGILEPKTELKKNLKRILSPESINVVIVPGLAFDMAGNRLGRGKGFYDRFIARLTKSTTLIALCYESQIVESVPINELDKPVNIIVTENRTIYCR
jgi:5-formyltetrahydrofolate cyclo-ligase